MPPPILTKYFARLIGLWVVLTVLGIAANRQASFDALNAFFSDPALMWITGIFTVLVGLVIVVAHNYWTGGVLPVLVTLYGWVALIKGLLFVWLPSSAQTEFYRALHFEKFYGVYFVVALALGGYLVYGGFKTETES
jgi:hypothetical protein